MIQDIQSIQKMMRELIVIAVGKINNRINNNNIYNAGIVSAYVSVLGPLYKQAKFSHIPLSYLSLHVIDPEKASFSGEIVHFDESLPLPLVQEKYRNVILGLFSDNILLVKERYEDCLSRIDENEFYKAMLDGYWEIFALMEKYGIQIIQKQT